MTKRQTGTYEVTTTAGETVKAFVPAALPPTAPPLAVEGALPERLRTAETALARLELASAMVPSIDWFVYGYVRKEAVVSSQIEGTQATLVDLLNFEAQSTKEKPSEDVEEICNYLDAIKYARAQLHSEKGPPLSMRLLNDTHKRLMHGVRGHTKQPGEVRKTQNWIGGSRPGNASFVPPPPQRLPQLLSDLEHFIHDDNKALHPLLRAGLVHVQFETIHPYLDGNGRMGRLLVALLLEHWKLLSQPLLYLSAFFKQHRDEYYRRLTAVRVEGDWEGWLDFFLDGVATIADEAASTARTLHALVGKDRERLLKADDATVLALRVFEVLPRKPIITVASVVADMKTTKPAATRAIEALIATKVLRENTGRKRDRAFAYRAYLDVLRVGTDVVAGEGRHTRK